MDKTSNKKKVSFKTTPAMDAFAATLDAMEEKDKMEYKENMCIDDYTLSDLQPIDPNSFIGIISEMIDLHEKKNTDYGDAWHTEYLEFGKIPCVIRLYEKVNRLKSLWKNGGAKVDDESFEDTLIDIANYAVMTLSEIRKEKK